ncbi:MAG: hypothetical protein ABL900_00565 [Burkholderiaceae bacterium]
MTNRRTITLGVLGAALVTLPGCMSKPLRPVNADGTYCYSIGRRPRNKLSCTPEPVPPLSVEADAKRFEPIADALTLYVVRRRWRDTIKPTIVSIDERTRVTTIPESIVRIRLKPGEHRLAVEWDGRSVERVVSGAAGEVRFVELVGRFWTWGGEFRWEEGLPQELRPRAAASKLIADIDLRG